jgi:RHS repeat-associated protein
LTQVTSIDGPNTFNYDATDQLTSASHTTQANENYTYDLNGNRTNAGVQTSGNNQLLTDGTYNYAYDDEGNRISRTTIATGAVTEYGWDYRNRLMQVVEKNAAGVVTRSSNYKYDVNNNRIAKTVDLDGVGTQVATTERYVYDGSHIALVFDGAGNQLQRFLHGTQVDQVLAQENANGDLLWALTDHQGSVRDVVDNQGNLLNHIVYDSFGNVTNETNSAINFRFGYTGREFDAETGLYYYRARYYDPQTGQFIGQDPLSFGAGDSNLYRYVGNNSVNSSDPFGLFRLPSLRDLANMSDDAFQMMHRLPIRPSNFLLDRAEEIAAANSPGGVEKVKEVTNHQPEVDLGDKAGDEMVEHYGGQLYDPATPIPQKIGAGVGLGFASLWTTSTSNATFDTLSCALGVNSIGKSFGLHLPKHLRLPSIPKIKVLAPKEIPGSVGAEVPSVPGAMVHIKIPKTPGIIEVPGIYKGQLPKGGGGKLLEKLLRAKNIKPTKQLIYKNIAEPSVIEAYEQGMNPANTVLGKQGERVLAQFNLKPKSFEFKVNDGILDLVINVK